jgi:peptidoglycan/LPS O-acetylase OafA/YrhL
MLVLRTLSRRQRIALVSAASIISLAFAALDVGIFRLMDGSTAYHLPIWHYFEFLIGLVAGLEMRDGWRPELPTYRVGIALLAGVAISFPLALPLPEVVLVVPFTMLILWLAMSDLTSPRGPVHPWLLFAGEASFAFYLVHEVVIVNLRELVPVPGPVQAVLMLVVACLAAAALHLVVERPANRALRDRSRSVALDT